VRDHRIGGAKQDHRSGHRNFRCANALANQQLAHVDQKFFRDVIRQALDFNFTGHDVVRAALELHTLGIAVRMHRHLYPNALRKVDALQIGVQHVALYWIELPIYDHHRRVLDALNIEIEDGVVARLAFQDLHQVLGIHGYRHGLAAGPVNNRWHGAFNAQTARFVFAPRAARFGDHSNIFSHDFFSLLPLNPIRKAC